VRAEILTSVARWLNETNTDRPFTDLYDTEGEGGFPGIAFMARPVVGGHFAGVALGRACGGRARGGLGFLEEGKGEFLEEGEGRLEEGGFEEAETGEGDGLEVGGGEL